MKDVKFFRINEENMNFIPNIISIDNEDILKEDIEKFIIDKDNYCFIGMSENKVVAFLYGYGMLRPNGKSMFYIHSVDVILEYQNKGIGTKLMEYVLKYIRDEKRYYKFFVLTEDENIKACKVYQKYANKEGQVLFCKSLEEV